MAFSGTVTSDFLKYIPTNIEGRENILNYAAGDFSTYRETLINYAKAVFPLDYNNFIESDFSVFLIEMMAAVGHIQSFKSDFIANESFLKTAKKRESVKKMLELIGIRMKGPISAAANAKITFEVPETVPTPSSVTISAANRAFSIQSPEDGGDIAYTIYKVKNDGTVDLDNLSTDLTFNVTPLDGIVTIEDAVIMEGSLVIETGVFESPEAVKSIELTQSPYVEKSAQVYIEGNEATEGIYFEEENLYYASGPTDKIFEIATDADFKPTILFGDNTISVSPSIGDTYTVTYRIGGGTRGNLAAEVINAPLTLSAIFGDTSEEVEATIENTSICTGGAEAESIEHAKKYAPLIFRRQDRLVTMVDYKSFVNTFISNYGSTGKANAVVRRAFSSANIIDIFVLEKASSTQLRKATPAYKAQLLTAMQEKKMLTDEPVVVDGLIRTLDLALTVTVNKIYLKQEPTIKAKIKDKILEYFNVDNNDFGREFNPQDLVRYLLPLTEVTFATVDNVPTPIKINFNEIVQLNNFTINIAYI